MTEDKDTPRGKEAEVDGTVQESSIWKQNTLPALAINKSSVPKE